jgi:hypothetical protein
LGTLFWTKSSGTSARISACRSSASSDASRVEKLFISTSGSRAPVRSRRPSTWRTMMSRNVRPSLTSTSDFGPVMPMLVPRPPLSLMTTAWSMTSRASASGSSSASGTSATGSMSASGSTPVSPPWRRS